MLEWGEMVDAREEERVEVLWGVGSQDEPSWQNVPLLVAVTWSEVINDPDVHPAIGLLVSIQLSTISQKHRDGVVRLEMWCNVGEIILAFSIVGEDIRQLDLTKEGVCDLLSITHLLCTGLVAPQHLNLWPNGDGCHQ